MYVQIKICSLQSYIGLRNYEEKNKGNHQLTTISYISE